MESLQPTAAMAAGDSSAEAPVATADGETPKINVRADVWEYGKKTVLDGQVEIEIGAATYDLKGEDRHTVHVGDMHMEKCQSDSQNVPRMVAYVGVFDGHDGPLAAQYCSSGLLQHILAETEECISANRTDAVDGTDCTSSLDAGIINGFHRAEDRFAAKLPPPTFEDVEKNSTRSDRQSIIKRVCCPTAPPRGGTTALTLSIYGEHDGGAWKPMPHVVVANVGDGRLLVDDGVDDYRQITKDHRPDEPSERRRLVKHVRKREAVLGREVERDALRVFPGGLAVSRTIGDLRASKAVTCTPDIFRVPLHASSEGQTHRFVLASDGLWDAVPNKEVGNLAARVPVEQNVTPDNGDKQQKDESPHEVDGAEPNTDCEEGDVDDEAQKDESRVDVSDDAGKGKELDANNDAGKGDELNTNGCNGDAVDTTGVNAQDKDKEVTPEDAASRLMERCIKNGGHIDDITILVVDVTYTSQQKES